MSTRKVTIKRIDIVSAGKIQGIILAFFALIFALLFALLVLLVGVTSDDVRMGLGGALLIVIMAPIIYGVLGFIAGIISALIYNAAASAVGGIQLDFKYDEGQLSLSDD